MSVALYRAATLVAGPAIRRYLARRLADGKEDAARLGEREGRPSAARPGGSLVWIHAASIGESLAVLSVVERLRRERPDMAVLMTSGTVTSARVLADRLPEGVVHQYAPVDRTPWVRSFLDHWRPSLVLWVESELWPAMLSEVGARRVPAMLVNARLSERSWRRWRRARWMSRTLLGTFDACLAQTERDAARLRDLGARRVSCPGNLKLAAPPLPAHPGRQAALEAAVAGRPRWLAFSTHPGEEEIVADAHALLAPGLPGLLTMIAPRHPSRGPEIARMLAGRGLAVSRRGAGDAVGGDADVLLADTVGELGLFFRAVDVALAGGSLVPRGGQNPVEAALLGCSVLHGPHMDNFLEIARDLRAGGASATAATAREIAREAGALLTDAGLRRRRVAAARAVARGKHRILDAVFASLDPELDRISAGGRDGG